MQELIDRIKASGLMWPVLIVIAVVGVGLFIGIKRAAADGLPRSGLVPIGEVASKVAPWTGPWVGASVGYAVQTTTVSGEGATGKNCVYVWCGSPFGGETFDFDNAADGVTGGISAGYNFQVSKVVLGVFADYDWMNTSKVFEVQTGPNSKAIVGDIGIDTMWSLGGRAGYLVTPHVLLYGLAAYTHVNYSIATNVGADDGGEKAWTFGGGVEAMTDLGWSLKLEYRFTDLGDDSFIVPHDGGNTKVKDGSGRADYNLHLVKLGLAYKF